MSLDSRGELVLEEGATGGAEADAAAPFFAPMDGDIVDVLISDYRDRRERIEHLAALMTHSAHQGVLAYFLEGNCADRDRRWSTPSVETLFKLEGAVAKLDAEFWQKALAQTDVYEAMPQKRRDEWNKAVMSQSTPPFEEANVRSTLRDLLAQRSRFFAERVDGLFRALSGEHVTNRPEGFAKRMILSYVFNDYGSVNYSMAGVIGDLRAVIAKFMGRDEPKHHSASSLLNSIKRAGTGEWHMVDGGALRIRVYKKGTAHLEIHPDMAWRLNLVLASLYPAAIPAEHRSRPARPHREFGVLHRPLPFSVLELFESRLDRRQADRAEVFEFGWGARANERAYELACQVLQLLGGNVDAKGAWHFDYPIRPVLQTLVHHGCIPDEKAFQSL